MPRIISRRVYADHYAGVMRALCLNAIAEYAAGVDSETPEFRQINRAVAMAERRVPAWHRAIIDRRILRELDYWRRIGETP